MHLLLGIRGALLSLWSLISRWAFRFFVPKNVITDFHQAYYDSFLIEDTYWMGVKAKKCPLDLWIYQELLAEIKPDLIIETGSDKGGSTLFLAHMCELLGKGNVVSVDIYKAARPAHPRITYLTGSSTSLGTISNIKKRIKGSMKVLVILDSDHACAHVLDEMAAYANLVTKGSYLIVEDTNINGHPVFSSYGPGPMEAVHTFLKTNKDFKIDASREKFYLTFNPGGYLKRIT